MDQITKNKIRNAADKLDNLGEIIFRVTSHPIFKQSDECYRKIQEAVYHINEVIDELKSMVN